MITLFVQCLSSLVRAAFAIMALRTARSMHRWERPHQLAWLATGLTFAPYSAIMLLQDFFAVRAWRAGEGSPELEFYLRLSPVCNHSRTFMMLGLYAALVALPFTGRWTDRRRAWTFASVVGVAFLAGVGVALLEGSLTGRHFADAAAIDIAGFAVLACTLFVAMYRDSMDRYLWMSMAMYGFTSVAGVLYFTALSWFASDAWTPPAWQKPMVTVVLGVVMVGLAWRRWRLAKRGAVVHGLMPAMRPAAPMLG
jgi:hypothetical protein